MRSELPMAASLSLRIRIQTDAVPTAANTPGRKSPSDMQYALKVFETEDHNPFRTIVIDGALWFVASDVCRSIELVGDAGQHVRRLDEEDKQKVPGTLIQNQGGSEIWVINESGLWALVLRSDKPEAKRFKRWLTSEVIPSIRKTGGYGGRVPAFIKRFNANWDRVDDGYFSVINELVVRLWGRLEMAGYVMPDKAMDGKELRPDISVGKGFASWLREQHPEAANDHSQYVHSTPQIDVLARQYPNTMLHLYLEFIDKVWIPECAEDYFRTRDPRALVYLPQLLPGPNKPKPGMMRQPTLKRLARRS